ncbi:TPA: RidA family protein [Citrobacter koseri]|uniref:RidA family protein n=1 Tax=Citrobacter werkmanii TaxID=67827 RepID=A0AA37ZCQ6_9ENTR|nr:MULTISPECIES: RidA family protein [Enterobacteriaceae]HAT7593463.1 RidA family protein [Citrobacter werkmanii]ELJ2665388.1 RidA family protein [Citrobacter koseri]MBJ8935860.1 RidA family protein [Citrobacter koseri]MBZ2036164.1 RidA family protein [Klebsiella pneumoniae]SXF09223.1 translation initiation inhibitor [Klebsiella variicola]
MARLVRKNYPQLGEVNAPYVHAVAHQGTLYISGLTAFGSEAQSGDVIAQASEIFRQLKVIATAEGITLDNLIKVTIFVTSIGSLKALRQVLYANYGESLPASSLVEVSALFSPDLHIEIEAVLALQ